MPRHAFSCIYCPVTAMSYSALARHVFRRHGRDRRLQLFCKCGAIFKSYKSFKRHCSKNPANHQRAYHHTFGSSSWLFQSTSHNEVMPVPIEQCGNDSFSQVEGFDQKNQQTAAEASFLLKLATKHRMSQIGIKDVMKDVTGLLQAELASISQKLSSNDALDSDSVAEQVTSVFDELCNGMFKSLESEEKRDQFATMHFNLVMPVALEIGTRRITVKRKNGFRSIEKPARVYYVPFLKQLQGLIRMPEVQAILSSFNEPNSSVFMKDVLSGEYAKSHVGYDKGSLFFSIYSDDFEVVNPIGSYRRKHKVTAYYWTLLNIPPEHRSKLKSIQLLCMGLKEDLKVHAWNGQEQMLSDFLGSLTQLANGVEMDIGCERKKIFGYLLFAVGDTPAAQLMGGFKEGVGGAEHPCRTCMVSKDDLAKPKKHSECVIRSKQMHDIHLNLLESADGTSRQVLSRRYGVVRPTFLSAVPEFDVTKCILHDPMHILLEGILKMEIKLLLLHLISRGYFTLAELNKRILNFEYSYTASLDKPQVVDKKHLLPASNLPQTAASMRVLSQCLPFMVGTLVPSDDSNWRNFMVLLQITLLCSSPVVSDQTIDELECLIVEHNTAFAELYPETNFTPKLHYLVHFPEQLRQFGPLRQHMCMRFEAKNGFFKLKRLFNFQNVPKSLSELHQKNMCMHMTNSKGEISHDYLCTPDRVFGAKSVSASSLPSCFAEFEPDIGISSEVVSLARRVSLNGINYSKGDVLLESFEFYELPRFIQIQDIIVTKRAKYIKYVRLLTGSFKSKLNGFAVKKTVETGIQLLKNMPFKWPQMKHNVCGIAYVQLQDVERSWLL